jgi:hypothetical protein
MGFLSKFKRKFIPRELSKPVDEFLDFGSDVVEKGITKPFASISDKLIPNELRFLAPYAAGIGTLMLPPGMNMMTRALLASIMNAGGQIAADESATGELSDLNKISMAIAGGLGALGGGQKPVQGATGADKAAFTSDAAYTGVPSQALPSELSYVPSAPAKIGIPAAAPDVQPGFFEGVGNVGKKGLEVAQDYVRGTRSDLAGFGEDPASLFKYDKTANILKGQSKLPGVTKAAGALAPTLSLGTADVAYEAAIDAQKLFDETEAAELAEAGASLEEIQNARRVAIREAMESAQFTDQEILDTLAEIGLKDGGIASLRNGGIIGFKDGGMLNFGGREMDLRGGGFVPIGKRERADDVPARLSKNEFVMTADAVRAAGGGSVNKGAQRMYDIMNRLEAQV